MLMKEANFFLLTKCFHSSRTFLSLAVGGAVCCFLSISHCCLFHTWCHPLLQLSCENACEITFNEGNISSSKGTCYHHFCHLDYTSKIGTSTCPLLLELRHFPLVGPRTTEEGSPWESLSPPLFRGHRLLCEWWFCHQWRVPTPRSATSDII